MYDLPPPTWGSISFMLTAIGVSSGTMIACLLWFTGKLEELRKQVDAFRIEVAHNYTSTTTLRDVENRMEQALEKLGERLDRSIDKLLDLLRNDPSERSRHKLDD